MVLKLLFKATLPLVAVVGVASYGLYFNGGDPAAIFTKIFGKSLEKATLSAKGAGSSLKSLNSSSSESTNTQLFTWKDESGVTHFSSMDPDNGTANSIRVNGNRNVVAAVPIGQPQIEAPSANGQQQTAMEGLPDERLPGAAGMNLPVDVDPAVLSEFLQSAQRR